MSFNLLQTTVNIGSQLGTFFRITEVGPLISGILSASLVAASLGFILYFLWGAMRWLTAGGDKNQVELARQKITNAFIGLVLVAAAWAIYLLVIYVFGLGNVINVGSGGGGGGFANGGGVAPPGFCLCGSGSGCTSAGTRGPRSLSDPQCYECQADGSWPPVPGDNSCTSAISCSPCS